MHVFSLQKLFPLDHPPHFLRRRSVPPDEVEQLRHYRYSTSYLTGHAVGVQQFQSLFALPAGMSEQGLLQGRNTQRVPSGEGWLPSVEGNGLPLTLRNPGENM